MINMKYSFLGVEGVRLRYKCGVHEEMRMKVIVIVRIMFKKRENEWDECAKSGTIVPLFMKGDRSDVNKYRCVCFLSICSSVLAAVIAKILSRWTETSTS